MSRPVMPAGSHTLLVDGRPVAPAREAVTHRDKGRGLLGTSGIDGALWLSGSSSVHMVGMRYPIDCAVLDGDGRVLHAATLAPWTGATRPRLRGRTVVEAMAGAFQAWDVRRGSVLTLLDQPFQPGDHSEGTP